ncbi:MAG: phosphatase PAP2 family protein [Gammaproteobacteria bacterium]|nr:phosphatase PAP2 family protein [Gammaproteobacteria bacterium]MCB1922775.1 phosphatase PAP2 family protein [Gammaproteobacteria bacterium]
MLFERLTDVETAWCLRANRRGEQLDTQHFFAIVSRLGDGVAWYLLMLLLPVVYGRDGVTAALHMLAVGIVALLVYKSLKHLTGRRRPCDRSPLVRRHAPMLDLYSFPSGHTMHAVGFTAVLLYHFPPLGVVVSPFVFLVASSRLVLGLHYPSDVIAGALIGGGVAWASIALLT